MNRKDKAILYAALGIIGLIGASASTKKNLQEPIYLRSADGVFEILNPSMKNQPGGWRCMPNPNVTCTYRKIDPTGETMASNMTREGTGIFQSL